MSSYTEVRNSKEQFGFWPTL